MRHAVAALRARRVLAARVRDRAVATRRSAARHAGQAGGDRRRAASRTADSLQCRCMQAVSASDAAAGQQERRGRALETRDPAARGGAASSAQAQPSAANDLRVGGAVSAARRSRRRLYASQPRRRLRARAIAAAHERLARIWRDWGLPALGARRRLSGATYFAPQSASRCEHARHGARRRSASMTRRARRYDARAALDRTRRMRAEQSVLSRVADGPARRGAHRDCRGALDVDPSMAAARNNLALAFAASGDLELPRTEFVAAGDRASAPTTAASSTWPPATTPTRADAFEEAHCRRGRRSPRRRRARTRRGC